MITPLSRAPEHIAPISVRKISASHFGLLMALILWDPSPYSIDTEVEQIIRHKLLIELDVQDARRLQVEARKQDTSRVRLIRRILSRWARRREGRAG